jgi:hypothetical protein
MKQSSAQKTSLRLFFCLFVIFCFSPAFSSETSGSLEPLRPLKTDSPPVIDGNLDDPVWKEAPFETGFKTWYPDYGIEMVENTVVYYAYDLENLYFAFRCFDSESDKIKASVNSRDKITSDDWICINLDSFNDQQSLYSLYVNPLGIQSDARYEGGTEDFSVDVIWFSHGRIDDQGYTVELKIPFKSIRYSHKEPVEMGVIFERRISRRTELGTFPELDPAVGPNFLIQMRPLVFHDIKHYTLVELLPAATYSRNSLLDEGSLVSRKGVGDLSLTAKYGLTSKLILDAALNPDFSQVEADAGQVDFNLRYALYFPEKRPFFLEGREKFNFGGLHSGDPLGAVVHTRTIVDPLLGFKINGRIGAKNTIASIYALDEIQDSETEEYAHSTIFRYKRSLVEDSFIGGFYTGRERQSGYNRVFGLDGQLRVNPASVFGYHIFQAQTQISDESPKDNGHALGLHYFSNTRNWILMLGFQDIGKDFQTETGYLTRNGLSRLRSGAVRMFYPKSKTLKRVDALVHSNQVRDKFSGLYETDNSLDFRFVLPQSTSILIGYRYATEVFSDERFARSGGRFRASRQFTKNLDVTLSYSYAQKIRYLADPYQGRGNDASLGVTYLPSEKLHLDLSLVYSDFVRSLDSTKEYDYTIVRGRTTYQLNKYLFLRAIVEYNSFRERIMTDLLASFTYIPGTVIHIGYGSLYERIQWVEGEYRPADRFLESKRGFFFKASFLWRL